MPGYSSTFNPGEPVILQGQQLESFYGVLEGRFALVESQGDARRQSIAKFLARATLIQVIEPKGIFGEIDSLLNAPQSYSVFALEPGIVEPVSVSRNLLEVSFEKKPHYGVKSCISFAARLKQLLDAFSAFTEEQHDLNRVMQNAARAYLAVVNELRLVGQSSDCREAAFACSKDAFSFSRHVLKPRTGAHTPRSSVNSAIVRAPTNSAEPRTFPAGTLICRKGMLGDRLFIIERGTVEVRLTGGTTIAVSTPGSVVGEIAVFLNLARKHRTITRTADVVCATDVRAVVVGIDEVEAFFAGQPHLMTGLLRAMVDRTRETAGLVEQAHHRLHRLLFDELRVLLEGHHELSHYLARQQESLQLRHPLELAAHQARIIYDRFRDSLGLLQ